MNTDEAQQLTPLEAFVQRGSLAFQQLEAVIEDRALVERIWRETGEAFARAVAEAERRIAAGEVQPEPGPRPGEISTELGTVRALVPTDVRAHGWD